jgi:serine/threonine-protein kinase
VIDGRYELDQPIGRGGSSEVWSGLHLGLDRMVALKFLHTAVPAYRDRMRVEAKLLATLRHPAIVEVYDLGALDDGTPYLVMELVEGESLDAYATRRGGRLPVADAVALVARLLAGLEVVHAAGVVHRDVKPDNVIVVDRVGVAMPKLVDFGIALRTEPDAPRLTAAGRIMGTPAYLSPEQILGADADATTDLWAVGVVLYELVTGTLPFEGNDMPALLRAIIDRPLPYPRDVPGLDGPLFAILSTALRKEGALRHEDARRMRLSLEDWLVSRVEAPLPAIPESVANADTPDGIVSQPAPPSSPAPTTPRPTLDGLIREKLRRG